MYDVAEAGIWMRNQDQRRLELPAHLTLAEREFFVALRALVDASKLSLSNLAEMTSPAAGAGELSLPAKYTATQWRHWLNGRSLPPRKAVRKLAEALATGDVNADGLLDLWASAFLPTPYPQEPGGASPRPRQPAAAPPPGGELTDGGPDARGGLITRSRPTFTDSYHRLSDPAARMFRLLSVHPGPDVSLRAAASLSGAPVEQAREVLNELAQADLTYQHMPGRFTCPEALRAYAAELARASETAAELEEALRRLLDHYLRSLGAAVALAYPVSVPVPFPPPRPGAEPQSFESDDQARAWLNGELRVVESLVTHAAERGLDVYCWVISTLMAPFLVRTRLLDDFRAMQEISLVAAGKLGEPYALGRAHYNFAHACALLGEVADSDRHLQEALECFTTAGDQAAAAMTLNGMAQLLMQQGEYPRALEREKEALRLRRAVGDRDSIAHSEDTIAIIYSRLGEYDLALRHCRSSLDLSRDTGARLLAADALTTLGFVYLALGEHKMAIASYMEVLAIYRLAGENASIAAALTGLGDAQQAAGDNIAARSTWQQALTLLKDQPNADDHPVRARLARLRPPT